ncbi:MAG TPA: DMT family transporter [Magnetospirillaceae bacterium]|nr:DMT family transporter [Magnetospirillaceae bacterium]
MVKTKARAPFGASLIILSSLFYASYGIWTTLIGSFLGGYTAAALRSTIVLLMLVPVAFAYKQLTVINIRRDWPYLVGLVASALLIWGPLYYAILNAGVGLSLAINYASIVMGMFFFGWLLAKEKLTRDKWISAGLGMTGLWLVFAPNLATIGWIALGAAFVSGFSNAAHMVIAKKLPYNATQCTVMVWTASLIANVPMALLFGERIAGGWHIEWVYVVIFAIASVAATWTFVKGLKLIDAGAAGVLGLFEIIFAVVIGALLFGERPSLIALGGIVVILIAAAIPYLKDYNVRRGTLGG